MEDSLCMLIKTPCPVLATLHSNGVDDSGNQHIYNNNNSNDINDNNNHIGNTCRPNKYSNNVNNQTDGKCQVIHFFM